jgi:hypothetical protein
MQCVRRKDENATLATMYTQLIRSDVTNQFSERKNKVEQRSDYSRVFHKLCRTALADGFFMKLDILSDLMDIIHNLRIWVKWFQVSGGLKMIAVSCGIVINRHRAQRNRACM